MTDPAPTRLHRSLVHDTSIVIRLPWADRIRLQDEADKADITLTALIRRKLAIRTNPKAVKP